MTDWIADAVGDYVEIALSLAGDQQALAELRRTLRPRIAASPLCDGDAFAREMENAFRTMWRRWCERPPEAQG
jgi:predicted O-linked N-acetylglucosamine transferase (SPINDLY family)